MLVYRGQTLEWIKMPLGTEVGLSPGNIVLNGDPATIPQKGHSSPHSFQPMSGQTAGCIKMPLGIEVGLGPGHIVLDGDPAHPLAFPAKGQSSLPLFCRGKTVAHLSYC